MTVSITEFISARLRDDEQQALSASPGPWHLNAEHDEVIAIDGIEVCTAHALSNNQMRNTARHIARHDPARVLREVEAKRAILELADEATGLDMSVDIDRGIGPRDKAAEPYVGDLIIRQMAQAYSDHPDYNPEWSIT